MHIKLLHIHGGCQEVKIIQCGFVLSPIWQQGNWMKYVDWYSWQNTRSFSIRIDVFWPFVHMSEICSINRENACKHFCLRFVFGMFSTFTVLILLNNFGNHVTFALSVAKWQLINFRILWSHSFKSDQSAGILDWHHGQFVSLWNLTREWSSFEKIWSIVFSSVLHWLARKPKNCHHSYLQTKQEQEKDLVKIISSLRNFLGTIPRIFFHLFLSLSDLAVSLWQRLTCFSSHSTMMSF